MEPLYFQKDPEKQDKLAQVFRRIMAEHTAAKVEFLDELDVGTLKSYAKKASADAASKTSAGKAGEKASYGNSSGKASNPALYMAANKLRTQGATRSQNVTLAKEKIAKKEKVSEEVIDEENRGPAKGQNPKVFHTNMIKHHSTILRRSAKQPARDGNAKMRQYHQGELSFHRSALKGLGEEVIDEASEKKLDAYRKKANDQRSGSNNPTDRKDKNRTAGSYRAFDKLTGRAKVNATKEEMEFIDELNTNTLASYAKKASADAASKKAAGKSAEVASRGQVSNGVVVKKSNPELGMKANALQAQAATRSQNVTLAKEKIAKKEKVSEDTLPSGKSKLQQFKDKQNAAGEASRTAAAAAGPRAKTNRLPVAR